MRPLLSRIRAFAIVSVLCGAFPAVSAGQAGPDTVDSRADAVAIIEQLRKIHTPEGIEVLARMTS